MSSLSGQTRQRVSSEPGPGSGLEDRLDSGMGKQDRPESDDDLATELMDAEEEPADLLHFDMQGNPIPQAVLPVRDTPEPGEPDEK